MSVQMYDGSKEKEIISYNRKGLRKESFIFA
ncbi:hypothetical protein SAMN05216235_1893 [Salinicoccus halodurans]|uniref:Uncharacterized protein n=1 Tax=Salinicoccus halodurans TaxID=407035 RepID=A0AA94HG28_9STAP|nr:hypothetical protein SAMN05216235_1893 [Salinicoccus halodurans]